MNLNIPNADTGAVIQSQDMNTLSMDNRIITRNMSGISKPRTPYIGVATSRQNKITTEHHSLSIFEPQSVLEALSTPQ